MLRAFRPEASRVRYYGFLAKRVGACWLNVTADC